MRSVTDAFNWSNSDLHYYLAIYGVGGSCTVVVMYLVCVLVPNLIHSAVIMVVVLQKFSLGIVVIRQ